MMSIINKNMSIGHFNINIDIKRKVENIKRTGIESIMYKKKVKNGMEEIKSFAQNIYQSNIF